MSIFDAPELNFVVLLLKGVETSQLLPDGVVQHFRIVNMVSAGITQPDMSHFNQSSLYLFWSLLLGFKNIIRGS